MWLAFSISVYLLLDVPGVVSWMHKTATKELEHQGAISSSMDGEDALPRPVVGKKGRWSMYEKALAAVHFFMFVQLVYWKFRDNVLIMLTQPCHILLFLQGVALLSSTSLGPLITVLQLPTLFGSLLAMIVPATSGLSTIEVRAYWIQHLLIQVGPVYLLSRQNFAALKVCNLKSIIVGIWICQIAHWTFYDWVDFWADVNVEFMLCPTEGMIAAFSLVPPGLKALLQPSWRTTLTWFVALSAIPLSYAYVLLCHAIRLSTASRSKKLL